MSELINARDNRATIRWKLLTSASALALTAAVSSASMAAAEDVDRPTIWIELGGQFEQQAGKGDVFAPSFTADNSGSSLFTSGSFARLEKPSLFDNGAEVKLTLQPSGSDWVFSAGIRFGRSNGHRTFQRSLHLTHVLQTTQRIPHLHYSAYGSLYYTHTIQQYNRTQQAIRAAGGQVAQSQTHAVVDFTAGKDVGLGMFGSGGTSDFSVGLRFAQFASKASGAINAKDPNFITGYITFLQQRFPSHPWRYAAQGTHFNHAMFQNRRSFHGIGPSVSWNASLPVLGEKQAGTLNVDWGANAAVLFGRQRANGSHQTSGYYFVSGAPAIPRTQHTSAGGFNRSRKIIVPNAGGFVGMSFNFVNAKVSIGYRGDFFFGAMDAGNDTRQTKTIGFFGPYASVSIGIGD